MGLQEFSNRANTEREPTMVNARASSGLRAF